jgi:hypothetical protein
MENPMETEDTPKKRKHRSWLWDHFTQADKDSAICNTCSERLSIKHGTNMMKIHLNKKHDISNSEIVEKKGKQIFIGSELVNTKLYVICNHYF